MLVKWKGLPACDSTWEWKGVLEHQYPDFDLEDKVHFVGEGIDSYNARPPIIYQYGRRTTKKT